MTNKIQITQEEFDEKVDSYSRTQLVMMHKMNPNVKAEEVRIRYELLIKQMKEKYEIK